LDGSAVSEVILRDYQREAVTAAERGWADGIQRGAEVLPTGSGKTVVLAKVAANALREGRAKRVLLLAHRDELLRQAVKDIHDVAPGLRVGVVKAGENQVGAPIVVASVQTLAHERRRAQLRGVGLVIVDECHHATADTYRAVLEHYGCFTPGGTPALGLTATMSRGDGVGLGEVWQSIVYERDIKYMITRGFLVPPRGIRVRVEDFDLSKVRKTGGDYSEGQLGEALAASMAPERIVDAYTEHAKGRPTLLFVPTVELAALMAERFNGAGVSAAMISGETAAGVRKATLRDFTAGRISVLVNCMILTEGTNLPAASCVIIARPTMHAGLYIQMVGRVLRTFPGKTDALVIDVVGASERHALAGLLDLMGERDSVRAEPEADGDPIELPEDEAEGESYAQRAWLDGTLVSAEVDLFHGQRARWQRTYAGHWFMAHGKDRYITVVPALSGSGAWDVLDVHRRTHGDSAWVVREVGDIGYAMAHGESMGLKLPFNLAKRDATWRAGPMSETQWHQARRVGVVLPLGATTSGQASDAIDVVFASERIDPRVPAVAR
jgi:superfamily II DNA or RNA helicase